MKHLIIDDHNRVHLKGDFIGTIKSYNEETGALTFVSAFTGGLREAPNGVVDIIEFARKYRA
jgi:hypothetical protein